MPDFRLSAIEVSSLVAWLQSQGRSFATLPEHALTPNQVRRTERYLEERATCLGCHRIRGRGGRIAPSLENLGSRSRPSFVLEMILDPGRAAPGAPMPHQAMPRRDAEWLAAYLLAASAPATASSHPSLADPSHPARRASGPAAPASGAEGRGAGLYARHCASCHGAGGLGDGWNASELPVPPTAHADAGLMSRRPDDTLYDGIHAGARVLDGSARMPAFGSLFTPSEIRDLIARVRALCGCEAPSWSRTGG
jgi:mono/diheme cytochrome c family protein